MFYKGHLLCMSTLKLQLLVSIFKQNHLEEPPAALFDFIGVFFVSLQEVAFILLLCFLYQHDNLH